MWLRSATSEIGVNSGRRLRSFAQPTAIGATPRASHIGDTIHGLFTPVIASTSFAISTTDRHSPGNR